MVLILKQNNEKPPSIQFNSKFYLESIHNIHTTLVKHILLARGGIFLPKPEYPEKTTDLSQVTDKQFTKLSVIETMALNLFC